MVFCGPDSGRRPETFSPASDGWQGPRGRLERESHPGSGHEAKEEPAGEGVGRGASVADLVPTVSCSLGT